MKPQLILLLALLAGSLLAPAAHAAAPLYIIELLLFENTGALTSEQWPDDPGSPDLGEVVDLEPRSGLSADSTSYSGRFVLRSRHELDGIVTAMKKAGGYRILKHIAWLQPSYGERRTRPVRIEAGSEIPGAWLARGRPAGVGLGGVPSVPGGLLSHRELEGAARVYVGKYLHLELDLLLHRNRKQAPIGTATAAEASLDPGRPLMETIRIRNHRRMRSRELHYLDHPVVGALVIATPVNPGQ
ncbi:CsiV family protein [Endothiovibrio diazotrophicus]